MLDYPEIAIGIVRALGERLKEAGRQLADLGKQLQDGEHVAQDSREAP
jgi:hypothetical protein